MALQEKAVREDVKIKMREVEATVTATDADGKEYQRVIGTLPGERAAVVKESWIEFNPDTPNAPKPGETIYVKTRKPWPAHITVGAFLKHSDGGNACHEYSWVPRAPKAAGTVKTSAAEAISALNDRLLKEAEAREAEMTELRAMMKALLNNKK